MPGEGGRQRRVRRARACRLAQTLDKVESLEKQFQGGDSGERRSLSRGAKVDPNVVLGLAEQRVEKLLAKFAADRTVRGGMHACAGPCQHHS